MKIFCLRIILCMAVTATCIALTSFKKDGHIKEVTIVNTDTTYDEYITIANDLLHKFAYKQGSPDVILSLADKAITLKGGFDEQALFIKAATCMYAQRYNQCVEYYKKLVIKFPENYMYAFGLANAYNYWGKQKEALQLYPLVYKDADDFTKADVLGQWQQVVETNPALAKTMVQKEMWQLLYNYALNDLHPLATSTLLYDKALEQFNKILLVYDSLNYNTYKQMGMALCDTYNPYNDSYNEERFNKGYAFLLKAVALNPNDAETNYNLGLYAHAQTMNSHYKYSDAVRDDFYTKAITNSKEPYINAMLARAELYYTMFYFADGYNDAYDNDYASINTMKQGLEDSKYLLSHTDVNKRAFGNVHYFAAEFCMHLHQWDDATNYLNTYNELADKNEWSYRPNDVLGMVQWRKIRFAHATEENIKKSDALAMQAKDATGDDEIIRLANEALKYDSNNMRAYQYIGRVYENQANGTTIDAEKIKKALDYYTTAYKLDPYDVYLNNDFNYAKLLDEDKDWIGKTITIYGNASENASTCSGCSTAADYQNYKEQQNYHDASFYEVTCPQCHGSGTIKSWGVSGTKSFNFNYYEPSNTEKGYNTISSTTSFNEYGTIYVTCSRCNGSGVVR